MTNTATHPMLPAPDETASFASFWQGSAEELRWLEEAAAAESGGPPNKPPAASGPWINPLDDIEDDPAAEETFLKISH